MDDVADGAVTKRSMPMAAEDQEQGPSTAGVVHVAILRVVKPGRELEFEKLIQEFFAQAEQQPGVAGAYLIRPFAGAASREYGILRSFNSAEHRDRFYRSDLYQRWNKAISPLVEGEPRRQHLHGMEAFFRESASSPPRWKMAVLTWVGVDIAVYAFASTVPRVVELPGIVNMLLVNALVVIALTWFLMPLITKLFDGWLRKTDT